MLLNPLFARAAVEVNEASEQYAIRGKTAHDLRQEMRAKGPPGAGGRRFDGYTKWDVDWRYWYRQRGGMCTIDRVQIKVKITTTLPVWQNEQDADDQTRTRWHRYREALVRHEDGHRQHGLAAARDVDRTLKALAAEKSCDALGAKANESAKAIIGGYNQRDLDYDRDTNHGATQNARFP